MPKAALKINWNGVVICVALLGVATIVGTELGPYFDQDERHTPRQPHAINVVQLDLKATRRSSSYVYYSWLVKHQAPATDRYYVKVELLDSAGLLLDSGFEAVEANAGEQATTRGRIMMTKEEAGQLHSAIATVESRSSGSGSLQKTLDGLHLR